MAKVNLQMLLDRLEVKQPNQNVKHRQRQRKVIVRATQEYRQDQDVLSDFFEECCELKRTNQVTAKAFYARYVKWCASAGEQPKSQKWLWPRLEEKAIAKDLLRDGYIYRGIGLNR